MLKTPGNWNIPHSCETYMKFAKYLQNTPTSNFFLGMKNNTDIKIYMRVRERKNEREIEIRVHLWNMFKGQTCSVWLRSARIAVLPEMFDRTAVGKKNIMI